MKARFYSRPPVPKTNTFPQIGAAAIIIFENKLLVEKRSDSGKWCFIGGGMKENESIEACIVREVKEETGLILQATNFKLFRIYSNPYRIAAYSDGNIRRIFTTAFIHQSHSKIPIVKMSGESRALAWVDVNGLLALDFAETHTEIRADFCKWHLNGLLGNEKHHLNFHHEAMEVMK